MGCTSCRYGRRAIPSTVMILAIRSLLFQADFCLTRCTLAGAAALKAAKSRTRNVTSLPTTTCGSKACKSGLSHINATWVRQVRRLPRDALSNGSSVGWSLRFLKATVPLPPPWNKATEVSSILIRKGLFPAGMWASQALYHFHTATAWLGPESETKSVPDSEPKTSSDSDPQ